MCVWDGQPIASTSLALLNVMNKRQRVPSFWNVNQVSYLSKMFI